MQKTKLIQLLSTLTIEEFRRLKKMLRSPFFTSNKNYLKLYEVLKKFYPDFSNPKLTKTYLFQRVYDGNRYNDNKLRMLIRDFTELVEDYMLWLEIKKDKHAYDNQMLSVYLKRDLFQWYERERQKLVKTINQAPFRDLEFYNEMYLLDFNYFFHPLTPKTELQDEVLIRLMQNVDNQFFMAKHRIMSEMLNRRNIKEINYEVKYTEAIEQECTNGFLSQNVVFKIYCLMGELSSNNQPEKLFFEIKNLLNKYQSFIRRIDLSLFITQLINFGIKRINNGDQSYYKQVWELYKLALEKDLVLEHQRLTSITFGNIVIVGCYAGEFEWTKKFIETYKIYLDEEHRVTTVGIQLGLWYFHQNDFDSAYELFLKYSFTASYQPKARFYLVRTLFEQFLMDNISYDFLIAQVEAFEKLLYRNHLLATYHQKVFLNSLQLLKKLIHLIVKGEKQSYVSFEKDIQKRRNIVAKSWFLQKVAILQ